MADSSGRSLAISPLAGERALVLEVVRINVVIIAPHFCCLRVTDNGFRSVTLNLVLSHVPRSGITPGGEASPPTYHGLSPHEVECSRRVDHASDKCAALRHRRRRQTRRHRLHNRTTTQPHTSPLQTPWHSKVLTSAPELTRRRKDRTMTTSTDVDAIAAVEGIPRPLRLANANANQGYRSAA